MVQHLIVPVDGSDASWRAVDVACVSPAAAMQRSRSSRSCSTRTRSPIGGACWPNERQHHDTEGLEVSTSTVLGRRERGAGSPTRSSCIPTSTVVMASHGRGPLRRTARQRHRGTAATDLRPGAGRRPARDDRAVRRPDRRDRRRVATHRSRCCRWPRRGESSWAPSRGSSRSPNPTPMRLGRRQRVRLPGAPRPPAGRRLRPPGAVRGAARQDVHDEVADFASRPPRLADRGIDTHGRTGIARFVIGSTAAAIVRHARCPRAAGPPHRTRTDCCRQPSREHLRGPVRSSRCGNSIGPSMEHERVCRRTDRLLPGRRAAGRRPTGRILLANPVAASMFGTTVDELVGSSVDELVPPEFRARPPQATEPPTPGHATIRPMGTGLRLFAQTPTADVPRGDQPQPVHDRGTQQTIATIRDVSDRQESAARWRCCSTANASPATSTTW
jgi:PAS domain-containing protein